jgi:hypothetical protein
METASFRDFRPNWWGIASVAIFVTTYVLEGLCLERGPYMQPRIYNGTCYEMSFVSSAIALACGIVAVRRGSGWWLLIVFPTAWMTIVSFLGEL